MYAVSFHIHARFARTRRRRAPLSHGRACPLSTSLYDKIELIFS